MVGQLSIQGYMNSILKDVILDEIEEIYFGKESDLNERDMIFILMNDLDGITFVRNVHTCLRQSK